MNVQTPALAAVKAALKSYETADKRYDRMVNDAVKAEELGLCNDAMIDALNAAEEKLDTATNEAIRLAGVAVMEIAEAGNYDATERGLLSSLFGPALEGRFSAYSDTQRTQLINRAFNLVEC